MRQKSLSFTLIYPFVALTLITGLAVTIIFSFYTKQTLNTVSRDLRYEIMDRVTLHLEQFLDIPSRMNAIHAQLLADDLLDPTDPAAIQRYFWQTLAQHPSVSSIYFGNMQGGLAGAGREAKDGTRYVTGTEGYAAGRWSKFAADDQGRQQGELVGFPNFDARQRPWYKAAQAADGAAWGEIYILFTGDDMALAPSRVVRRPDGTLIGVVATDIFLSQIHAFLTHIHLQNPGLTFIMEPSGYLVASSAEEPVFRTDDKGGPVQRLKAVESANPVIARVAGLLAEQEEIPGNGTPLHRTVSINGARHFLTLAQFEDPRGLSLRIAVAMPASSLFKDVYAGRQQALLLVTLAILVTVAFSLALARSITRPIQDLQHSAAAVAKGDLSHRLAVSRHDEIGDLTRSFNDMTEQLQSMSDAQARQVAELRELESRFRSTFEQAAVGMAHVGMDGEFLRVNQKLCDMLGYSVEELKDLSFQGITHPDDLPADREALERFQRNEISILSKDKRYFRKDGSVIWVAITVTLFRLPDGSPHHFITVVQDIDDRIAAFRSLEKARLEAEKADMAKSEFLASMSHDLRTPLNAVLGYAEFLEIDPRCSLNEIQIEHVESILHAGRHLLSLVNDILDLAQIEADKLQLLFEDVPLRDILDECISLIRPAAGSRNVAIIEDLNPGLAPVLRVDRRRFTQCILNLLSNAVKYNKLGGSIRITGTPTEDGAFRITITDTGIGIPADNQQDVFKIFQRFGADPTIAREGTGIGLSVTRLLVERMNGRIDFESVENSGSSFWVEVPLGIVKSAQKSA
ncbi:MAG: PAS domain S-box protein [Magnetospiraceae bacterium]